MKGKRSIIVLCVICIISIIGTVTVYAKDTPPKNIEMTGGAKSLIHVPNDEVFLSNLKMIPGSSASGTISIYNTEELPYKLTLKAEQITNGEYVGEKYVDILDHINVEINYNGKVIFNGPISSQDDKGIIDLGTFNPGSEAKLEAKAVLDTNIGNEYKNKYGEVKWIFTAVADEDKVQDAVNNQDSNNSYLSRIPKKVAKFYKTSDPLILIFLSVFGLSFIVILIKAVTIYMKTRGGVINEKE